MSSTRYRQQQPLQIYQDPVSYDHAPMPSSQSSFRKSSSPLRPVKNASSRRNIVFNPPASTPNKASPHKLTQNSSSSPPRPYSNKLNLISMPPPGGPNFQTDSMEKKQPMMSKFNTGVQKPLFATFSTLPNANKENYQPESGYQSSIYSDNLPSGGHISEEIYGQKSQSKRVLLEAPEIEEPRLVKKSRNHSEPARSSELVPILPDDGSKPGHSYAMLIGMAILRAPNQRLTLAQIYKWISDTYSYYSAAEAGWQNSIRHNLSLNKAFVKQERPKDDPGKGNYWAIEKGMERLFYKDKHGKKSSGQTDNSSVLASTPAPTLFQEAYKSTPAALQDLPSSCQIPESTPGGGPDISSDATIPASDAFAPEEEAEESYVMAQSSNPILSSPPPQVMHSSPPVARHNPVRDDTPPPVPRFPSSSRTRSHKRGFASMDDSGYFSSLNSSALRGPHGDRLPTSEADRPRIKRGRAEEEIARLRGSSYDSPTKPRAFPTKQFPMAPPSSSPIRRGLVYDSSQMLPPLTPAVKLRAPLRAPPSVSPNTNLRLHRESVRQLVGSPEHDVSCLSENLPWSPAFHIDETSNPFYDFFPDFSIFEEEGAQFRAAQLLVPGNGSPEKRSAKRPRMDRAPHSTNVLTDISNMHFNKSNTSTPQLKFTPRLEPPVFESPSKMLGFDSPNKYKSPALNINSFDLPNEDFFGTEFLPEDASEFSGMDILQGFQKIGAGGKGSRPAPKGNNARLGMTRSFTSRF